MRKIKCIVAASLLALCASSSVAQSATSSYFLEGAFYNYKLNPAMKSERGFLSALVGNVSLKTNGNVGLSTFLYPKDDKLTTFMSGSVDQKEFLDKLPDYARLGVNLDETILASGFRLFGGYTTIDLSLHSSVAMSLPKGLFEFAKKGLQDNSYNFSNLNVNTMNYLTASLGYSHDIFKGFRLGANVKYIQGLAYADIMVDKLNVEMSGERWKINSHAEAKAALFCEANPVLDQDGLISGIKLGDMKPSASGVAFDAGLVWDMNFLVRGLKLSASVVDLGFIRWKHMMKGSSPEKTVEFTGFDELDYNNAETTINSELTQLGDDAMQLMDFKYDGTSEFTTTLDATMFLGAEYSMPFYDKLSVAFLYAKRFTTMDYKSWYEMRGYVNLSPAKWLDLSVNYGSTTYGKSLGWVLNFHPAGINLFIGSDYMITKVTPQYLPINDMNAHVTVGLSLALGSRK